MQIVTQVPGTRSRSDNEATAFPLVARTFIVQAARFLESDTVLQKCQQELRAPEDRTTMLALFAAETLLARVHSVVVLPL
jgi:hypothetical protein